jgi:hypothetical protein
MNTKIIITAVIIFAVIVWFSISKRAYYTPEDHPVLNEISRRFGMLSPEYGKIPLRKGGKSYTEDKTVITLCLIDPETKDYYDINVLMYVALHELSHCITKADGDQSHGDEFKNNFASLLKRASAIGIYDSKQAIPLTYCGVDTD